jgi:hypothetical protein
MRLDVSVNLVTANPHLSSEDNLISARRIPVRSSYVPDRVKVRVRILGLFGLVVIGIILVLSLQFAMRYLL